MGRRPTGLYWGRRPTPRNLFPRTAVGGRSMADSGIEVVLADGSHRHVPRGVRARELLGEAGGGGSALAARWNGEPIDLDRPLEADGRLEPITFPDREGRDILQHSSAHVIAKAVTEVIPGALPTHGPPTEEGFFYDFDTRPITEADRAAIEEAIRASVKGRERFVRSEISRDEAERLFAGNPHKLAYLRQTPPGDVISIYRTGGFVDLCRGPHVPDTHWLRGIHLLGISAVTADGTATGAPRQRVRGVGFPTREALDAYLALRKEAEARDHRAAGTRLELFHFVDEAPGFPFWLPRGMIVVRELEKFVREHLDADGYSEIRTPLLFAQSVYETSGHWDHYRANMFQTEIDGRIFGWKPMNCPGAMMVFRYRARSYRELPLRLAEFAPLHRYEASGTLHGLTRVREFVQDDAHIFVTEEQIEEEIRRLLAWVKKAYSTFRLNWTYELSTRPTGGFLGDPAQWDRAEATLERVLKASGVDYKVSPGEGAFYGPKIDIHIRDSLGRPWQGPTIQLDYQQPLRFQLAYQGPDGALHTPVVIHRTILGSWERFFGVFLEHCGGRLPPWLCPVQVRVLPLTDAHQASATALVERLRLAGLRAESAGSQETLGKRIREGEVDRIPYVIVLGDAEQANGTVAVRIRGTKGQSSVPEAEFLQRALDRVRERSFDP
jgi:threonyl-tRNA synthetase